MDEKERLSDQEERELKDRAWNLNNNKLPEGMRDNIFRKMQAGVSDREFLRILRKHRVPRYRMR